MADRGAQHEPRSGPGPVMVIGGAEDKMKDRVILSRFVKDAGGPDARVVVIATASSLCAMLDCLSLAWVCCMQCLHARLQPRDVQRVDGKCPMATLRASRPTREPCAGPSRSRQRNAHGTAAGRGPASSAVDCRRRSPGTAQP